MSPSTLSHLIPRICRRVGLVDAEGKPAIHLHGLRHSAGSIALAEGVPLTAVSAQLRHSRPDFTARVYAHVLGDAALDAFASANPKDASTPDALLKLGPVLTRLAQAKTTLRAAHANTEHPAPFPRRFIDAAADAVAVSAFGFQGQKCSACSRAIVEAGVYDAFLEKLKNRVTRITVGDPAERRNELGPVINERANFLLISNGAENEQVSVVKAAELKMFTRARKGVPLVSGHLLGVVELTG